MNIIPHILNKVYKKFTNFFEEYKKVMTKPTFTTFIWITTSIMMFGKIYSIKYLYDNFLKKLTHKSLSSFYYFLAYSKIDIEKFILATVKTITKRVIPNFKNEDIFLIIDDSLVPKFGTHFVGYKKHFDHCSRNNSSYLMGNSFVCCSISIPIKIIDNQLKYLTLPIGIKLYTRKESKLVIASNLIKIVMEVMTDSNVILLCDSWYTKGEVVKTVASFSNLDLVGAVRHDTAIFEIPKKHTGRGRPRKYGQRVNLQNLNYVKSGKYYIAKKQVMTRLFEKPVFIHVTVTNIQDFSSLRLYISTKDTPFFMDKNVRKKPKKNPYLLRWDIEVLYWFTS